MSGWYSTPGWRRRRLAQLRSEPLCRYCSQMGQVTPATVADHIEPHRGDRGRFWEGELQSLCASCHNSAKQSEEARGYSTQVGLDGLPVDVKHPAYCRDKG